VEKQKRMLCILMIFALAGCSDSEGPGIPETDIYSNPNPENIPDLPTRFDEELEEDAGWTAEEDTMSELEPDVAISDPVDIEEDIAPDIVVDPCGEDGDCNPSCDADPDCPPPPNPCLEDGVCNQTECSVGEDPDCDIPGPTCEEDGFCNAECWESDPDCGCESLGIGSDWSGTFEGEIPYQFFLGLGDGTQDVEGSLSFQIECLASKYVVQGEMSGAEDSGVPFTVTLSGSYNPSTETLTAQMLDGVVLLLPGVAEITFEGIFEGVLVFGDHFEGTWSGASTGGAGGVLEATGSGTWAAYPQ